MSNNTSTKHPPQFFISLYGWTYWLPILMGGFLAIAFFLMLQIYWLVFIFLILTAACLAFYRDFDRPIPTDANIMVAPADGKITEITEIPHYAPFDGPALKVSIFLSVLDVHVNRAPCDATVLWTRYEEGLFLDARHPDCSTKNQSNTIALGPPNSSQKFSKGATVPLAVAPYASLKPIAQVSTTERPNLRDHFVDSSIANSTVFDRLEKGVRYTEKEALEIIIPIAKTLSLAHQDNLIHGHISPQNIATVSGGTVKLVYVSPHSTSATDFNTRQWEKTDVAPYYISPEQIRGELDIDARADLYSLGATLYHMITGRVPFDAPMSSGVMHKHFKEDIVPPNQLVPELSQGVGEIIQLAMAKKKVNRYANADEMITDLEKVATGGSPLIAHQVLSYDSPAKNEIPTVILKQIVGAIARRIIAPLTPGESLTRGQRIGMIAFGSRTELYVPANQNWKVVPPLDTHVKGGQSILLKK